MKKTDQAVDRFVQEATHLAAMLGIHTIFGLKHNPEIYNQFLKKEDVEKAFLDKMAKGGLKRFIFQIAFRLIATLVEPMISEHSIK